MGDEKESPEARGLRVLQLTNEDALENTERVLDAILGEIHAAPATSAVDCLAQIVPELAAAGRMAQLAQRLRLDLADALARHAEVLADLLQRVVLPVLQPEAHLQHLALAVTQPVQQVLHLLLQKLLIGLLDRDRKRSRRERV